MKSTPLKITIEIGTAGIDVTASPLAEMFLKILQERLQEQVTPEFVAYCLYQAAKKQPPTPKRVKKEPAAAGVTITNLSPAAGSAKAEGTSHEK